MANIREKERKKKEYGRRIHPNFLSEMYECIHLWGEEIVKIFRTTFYLCI